MAGVLLGFTLKTGLFYMLVGMWLQSIPQISIEDISVGVLPLLIPYGLMVLILVFLSGWVTWLPDLVYGSQLR